MSVGITRATHFCTNLCKCVRAREDTDKMKRREGLSFPPVFHGHANATSAKSAASAANTTRSQKLSL